MKEKRKYCNFWCQEFLIKIPQFFKGSIPLISIWIKEDGPIVYNVVVTKL